MSRDDHQVVPAFPEVTAASAASAEAKLSSVTRASSVKATSSWCLICGLRHCPTVCGLAASPERRTWSASVSDGATASVNRSPRNAPSTGMAGHGSAHRPPSGTMSSGASSASPSNASAGSRSASPLTAAGRARGCSPSRASEATSAAVVPVICLSPQRACPRGPARSQATWFSAPGTSVTSSTSAVHGGAVKERPGVVR